MKRLWAALLTVVLLIGLLPMGGVSAAENETVILAGSDFQVSSHNTSRIEQVLSTLEMYGITKADQAFFCGDYTLNSVDENQGQSAYGIAALKRLFNPIVGNHMTFVQGNHDPADTTGLSKSGNNDPVSQKYGAYVIHEDQYLQYNWDNSRQVAEETAANLKKYLDEKVKKGWNKPIFILSHVGLHWGNRTIIQGSAIHGELLVDVLNGAAEKGLNIIFLYGHDHSGGYADFLGGSAIYFKKGDQIEVCTGEKKEHRSRTIKFTYMNAGYIGYYSTDEASCDATVTMSVFRIKGNEVTITRFDGNFNLDKQQYGIHNLKSAGVWHPNYSQKGYHAEPNTQVYASSRKVTATGDVQVSPPKPVTTTSTKKDTAATQQGGAVIQKATETQSGQSNNKGDSQPTGDVSTDPDGTVESNDQMGDDDTLTIGTTPSDEVQLPQTATSASSLIAVLLSLVGVGGLGFTTLVVIGALAVLVPVILIAVILLLILKKKKKSKTKPEEGTE